MSARLTAIACAGAVLAACGTDDTSFGAIPPHRQVVETFGDTTVVRTLSGSVWGADAILVPETSIGALDGPDEQIFGSIASFATDDDRRVYVLDRQARHVRVFDSTGTYLRTLGRRGEGPGELRGAASVALLPDGRVLVHESVAPLRIQVYGPGQADTEEWVYREISNPLPPRPLEVDRSGRIFLVAVHADPGGRISMPVIVIGPDGTRRDTHLPPGGDFEPPSVELRFNAGGATLESLLPVPLTARHHWAAHPNGHFLTGISSDYRIHLGLDSGALRIERVFEPVAISDAERDYYRDDLVRAARMAQPGWRWNGPPIPATRPPFRGLAAGRDGRIWVTVSTGSYTVDNEGHDPRNPDSHPVFWRSPLRYDVFEPDGTYLGAVVPPEGFARSPPPVFDRDNVWALTTDESGVERVVRYRIAVGR